MSRKSRRFRNGQLVIWTSNKERERLCQVVTEMYLQALAIVRVVEGLPGESGTYIKVPISRLTPKGE